MVQNYKEIQWHNRPSNSNCLQYYDGYKIISKTFESLVVYSGVKYYQLSYVPFYDYCQRLNSTSKQFVVFVADK